MYMENENVQMSNQFVESYTLYMAISMDVGFLIHLDSIFGSCFLDRTRSGSLLSYLFVCRMLIMNVKLADLLQL